MGSSWDLTFGSLFQGFTGTSVDLLLKGIELASNVGSVTIENRAVAVSDLTGVVEDDDLGNEGCGFLGRVLLGVTTNVSSTNVLDGNVLDAMRSNT
jgi:hypothetical protein